MTRQTDKFPHGSAIALVLGVTALFLFSHLALLLPDIVASPDENANAVAAVRIARTGLPALPVDVLAAAQPFVRPRSMVVVDGMAVPESFLGFPLLAGAFARILGAWIVPFVTPLIAALGVAAFFFALRRIAGQALAALGAVLLMTHPAYWYNAQRGMFHNVAFVAFLLFAALAGQWALRTRSRLAPLLAGAALGAALAIRTSEIVWIAPLVAALTIVLRRRVLQPHWIGAFVGAAAALLPVFVLNARLYGDPLSFGYLPEGAASVAARTQEQPWLLGVLFPFGLRAERSVHLAWNYLVLLAPWVAVPAALGATALLVRVRRTTLRPRRLLTPLVLLATGIGAAAWLVLAYGSWEITEQDAGLTFFLGSSYVRYWLPVTIGLVVLALFGVQAFLRAVPAAYRSAAYAALLTLAVAFGTNAVYRSPAYGVDALAATLEEGRALRRAVVMYVPSGAVVLSGTADKWLFPTYRVIPALRLTDPEQARALRLLVQERPVYLLVNSAETRDPPILEHLAEARLVAKQQRTLSPLHTLYRVQTSPLLDRARTER